ncbi:MAG: DUF1622 domain-containing protein [Chryseolinea sp.]
MTPLEEAVKLITLSLGSLVDGAAALIIAHAIIKAIWFYMKSPFQNGMDRMEIRLSLGKSLALALEFLLAADILRTAVAPNWDDIGKLAAIAVLRTLLNYFLERELKHSEIKSV